MVRLPPAPSARRPRLKRALAAFALAGVCGLPLPVQAVTLEWLLARPLEVLLQLTVSAPCAGRAACVAEVPPDA